MKLAGTPTSSDVNHYQGIGFSFTLSEGNTNADRVLNRVADLFVAETANGLIRINDEATTLRPTTGNVNPTYTIALNGTSTFVPGTLRVDVALAGTGIGSTAGYKVFFDAGTTGTFVTLTNRSFVLGNDNQLYAGIEERSTPVVYADDFTVSTRDEYDSPTNPTAPAGFIPMLTSAVTAGHVKLSWAANYAGWKLQVQTNGLGTNWVDVPGTETVTTTNLPFAVTNAAVFYRLSCPSIYLAEGMRVLNVLNTQFYSSSTKRYVDSINSVSLEKASTISCWGAAYVVHALALGAICDPRYDAPLNSFVNQLSWYINGPGYASTRGGQRFFDDNSILARALMLDWIRCNQTQSVLDKAMFAMNYVFTNRDIYWGLPEQENDLGKWHWGSGIAGAQAKCRLMYYEISQDTNAFYIGTNYWAMFNDPNMHLQNAAGLYNATVTLTNGIWVASGGSRASHTVAVTDVALQLYHLTGDTNCLNIAVGLGNDALNKWYTPGGGFSELATQGSAGALEMFCDMYEATGDVKWYNVAKDICDFLINNCRDKGGYYPTGDSVCFWNVVRTTQDPPVTVNTMPQAAAAIALLKFAYLDLNKNFVHIENKDASGRWLEEPGTVADGTGTGQNTLAVDSTHLTAQTQWQYFPVAGQPGYYRLQNRANGYWLECTSTPDVTQGQPSPTADGDTLAVRAVDQTHAGASTMWQKVNAGSGYYYLQNQQTGYRLQATTLTDTDGATDGGWQVRAEPQTKTDDSVCFREVIQ